jgi:hypothetical protein
MRLGNHDLANLGYRSAATGVGLSVRRYKNYSPDNLLRRAKQTRSQAKALDEIWLKNALEDVAQAYEWLALKLAAAPTKTVN